MAQQQKRWTPPPFALPLKTKVDDEQEFQNWYRDRASKLNLDLDPDAPEHYYDYRAAFRAGAEPDQNAHWPSEYKLEGHPNLIVDGINTKTGQPASKRWEPPPFVLKKSQQQLDEEAEKNKPIDKTPGRWVPPDFAGIPNQFKGGKVERTQEDIDAESAENRALEAAKPSLIEKIYHAINKSYLPEHAKPFGFSGKMKQSTDPMIEWGESQKKDGNRFINELKNNVQWAGRVAQGGSEVLEEMATNPLNLGLMALTSAPGLLFGAAKTAATPKIIDGLYKAANPKTAQTLYNIARKLEAPAKLAMGGQVAHGGTQAYMGESTSEKLGGVLEMLMGATGLIPSRLGVKVAREYPQRMGTGGEPVNTGVSHGPKEQLKFPLPRAGNPNPIPHGEFKSGPRGTYKEGDLIYGELGGNIPAETAYNYGTVKAGKTGHPYVRMGEGGPETPVKPEVDTVKLEQIRQYMNAVQNKQIPENTKFEDYVASLKPAVTNEAIVAPDKGVARYSGYQEGFEELPGFHQYNVPTETGGLTTIAEAEAIKRGYDVPEKRIPNQNMEPYSGLPIEGEQLLSNTPDLNGSTLMTGERVRDLLQMEPSQAVADGLVEIDQSQGTTGYRMLPDVRQLANPVQSIGEEIINPVDDVSTGIDLNESSTPIRASDQWQEIVDELDARNAPDSEYRDILSTGSKEPLGKRETWRGRVQKYIQMDRERNDEPQFSRVPGEPGDIDYHENDPEATALRESKLLGIDPNQYKSLEDLQWAITQKTFQEVMKTGKNPLVDSEWIGEADPKKPLNARSEKGGIKISVNVKRAADEVTTAYSGPLSGIMIREGGQNAFDAVRHLGPDGIVNFKITTLGMEITDNGKGMSREELETVFSNLNETGKVDEENATGGKGVGKASYMRGGDYFEVKTVALNPEGNKVMVEMAGGPDEFLEHVDVYETIVPQETPTGTTIKTRFKKGQSYFDAGDMYNRIVKFTRGLQTQISKTLGAEKDIKLTRLNDGKSDKIIGKMTFTNGGKNDVVVRIPGDIQLDERTWIKAHFLNNGMYQFSGDYYLDMKTPDMPSDLIIDIHPYAKETTAEYPFPTPRESIKDELQKDINKFIKDTLAAPQQEKRRNILNELYTGFVPMPMFGGAIRPNGRNSVMFDSGNRLRPEEVEMFYESKIVRQLITFTDNRIAQTLDNLDRTDKIELMNRLEGTGLVLDEGLYGIHIPNPTTDKSTILINYFAHAINKNQPGNAAIGAVVTLQHEIAHIGHNNPDFVPDMVFYGYEDDPRVPKYLAAYLEQIQNQGGKDAGHGFAFAKRLGDVYARNGIGNTLDAITELTAIFQQGHKLGGYSPELQGLLQIYSNSRRRTAVTEDVLSRTGDKSKITRKGPIPPPEDSGSSGTGTSGDAIAGAIGRLKEALVAGKIGRDAQDLSMSAERSQRAGKIAGVKTRGMAGYQQQLGMLKGPLPKAEVEGGLAEEDVDVLINAISDSEQLRPYQEISTKRGLVKLLMGEAPQNSEMALLTQVFGDPDLGGIVELHAGLGGISPNRRLVNNVLHLAKTMKASMDLSGSLRQGLPFIDRKEYWKAFWNMHKYLGSEASYNAGMEVMKSHPDFDLIMETPLFLAGFKGQGMGQNSDNVLANREEQFLSEWGDHIPLVKDSQRAYVGFLDELRFNVMVSFLNDMKRLGIPTSQEIKKFEGTKREITQTISTPELDEVAKFVNIFTGRGSLGRFEKMAVEANIVLWSPKFLSSRLTILNPAYYVKASPFVQKQAFRSLFVIAGAGLTMLGLAKLNGAEVEYEDATSADFMKAKFGNTRFDPWAGLQQNVVAQMRILTYIHNAGKFLRGKPINKNQKYRPGSGYNTRTARDVAIDFAENKESPLANFVSSMSDLGKSYEPSGASKLLTDDWNLLPTNRASKELINLYSPMMMDTIIDLAKDDPGLLPLGIMSLYGGSVQTYDQRIPGGQYRPRVPRLVP